MLVGNSIAQPILLLCQRVSEADGSLERRCAPLGTHDELEVLAQSFDERTEALRKIQEHLEQRVKERTHSLSEAQGQLEKTLRQLRENSEYLEQAQELAHLGSWTWNIKEGTLIWSDETYRIFGFTPHSIQVSYALFLNAISEEDRNAVKTAVQHVLKAGSTTYEIEYRIRRPNGEIRHVLEKGRILRDEHGQAMRMLGTVLDISSTKQVEQALIEAKDRAEQADNAKSRFLASMSHEIRTPMNAVINLSRLALQTDLTEKQRDYINKVLRSGQHLLGVINDILDFSKIEAGKMSIEKIPFNLHELLDDVLDLASVNARKKQLEILVNCPVEMPESLLGDPLRLRQVLNNLLSNAVKFTEQGEILLDVDVAMLDKNLMQLEFSLCDSGIGMSKEQITSLFQAFHQADDSISRRYGGTGLGLAISRRLLRLMQTDLYIESDLGVGTTFSFTLRLPISHQEDPNSSQIAHQHISEIHALVVDDNATARQILTEIMQGFGARVETANSGEQALSLLCQRSEEQEPFDLVLLDFRLGGMDGLAVQQQISEEPSIQPKPRSILVTAYGNTDLRQQALQLGCEAVFDKPINPSRLLNYLSRHDLIGQSVMPLAAPEDLPQALRKIAGARILLVEDNDINQQIAEEQLAGVGMQVTIVNNGAEAVSLCESHMFDLILMDLEMPVMDGYEATRRLRLLPSWTIQPIVAMTAHALSGDRERCLAAGMNDHLSKPIELEELYAALVRWIPERNNSVESACSVKAVGEDSLSEIPKNLPGIAVAQGLGRVNGNWASYRKLLLRFRERHLNRAETLQAAVAANRFNEARQIVHSIKGVAGNLGATELYQIAAELENLLMQRDSSLRSSDVSDILARFTERLQQVFNSIATLVPEAESIKPDTTKEQPLDQERIAYLLNELALLLETDLAQAHKCYAALGEIFAQTECSGEYERLGTALYDYDMDHALDIIKRIALILDISLELNHG